MNDAMLVCSETKHALFAFLQQVNNISLQNISFNISSSIVNEIKNITKCIWQSYWIKCYFEFSEDKWVRAWATNNETSILTRLKKYFYAAVLSLYDIDTSMQNINRIKVFLSICTIDWIIAKCQKYMKSITSQYFRQWHG